MREDKGIDQSVQKVWWDLMAQVGQADEDTIALLGEGRYVRVPGEVLVEHSAEVPQAGALTDRVLRNRAVTGDMFRQFWREPQT